MAFVGGYTVFLPGFWSVPNFLFSYMMIFIFPVLFVGWKLTHRTRWKRATEMDLRQDLAEIEQYEANFIPRQERGFKRVLDKLFG